MRTTRPSGLRAEAGPPVGGGSALGAVAKAPIRGRFAMLGDGLGFNLIPWRLMLERRLGQSVSGLVRDGGDVSWTIGRSRGQPSEDAKNK